MAGDWIKMRKSLVTDGRIVRMMSALQADRFRTIGGLLSAWCLLDEQTEDGGLDGYTRDAFDEFVGFPGLASAMISVGWLTETSQGLMAPNFTEHNGATAKRRAQDSVRKMSARQADKCPVDSGRKPEQEKRREEKSIKQTNNGKSDVIFAFDSEAFRETWDKWRRHRIEKQRPLGQTEEQEQNRDIYPFGETEAIAMIEYSIRRGCIGLLTNGEHKRPEAKGGKFSSGKKGIMDYVNEQI